MFRTACVFASAMLLAVMSSSAAVAKPVSADELPPNAVTTDAPGNMFRLHLTNGQKLEFLLDQRLARLVGAKGSPEYITLEESTTREAVRMLRRLKEHRNLRDPSTGALAKADPYPCMMSPCTSGRIYYDASTGQWNFNPSIAPSENHDSSLPVDGAELSIGEYDLLRWLNHREAQCNALPTLFATYVVEMVAAGAACATVETGVGALACAAALAAAGLTINSFDDSWDSCYNSEYSTGGG